MRLLVDGMNVIGSRPDGWWRDRDGAVRRLAARLAEMVARHPEAPGSVTVVFDGRPPAGLPEGRHDGVLVLYARRPGRDAADERIVDEVAHDPDPASLTVVTSDRALAGEVRRLGAAVRSAPALAAELDGTAGG